ncbi:MAG: transcriptional regulator [Candidatus Methanoperedens sp.]|nr:transcriptional regulator [Candidatus Methanoperedens sp.]MCZ7405099.1 transcriptional regulator [Candidatus Methanoperedens sp.]
MNKELLIDQAVSILGKAGFIISERCDTRPRSFDIAARRNNLLLLIKIISNIDGLNEETTKEMQFLSRHLHGYPIVIGEKTRDHSLEGGVVYFRYGIPAINISTMQDYFVEEMPPLIYAEHGGLYVNLDGFILKQERIKKNISLGALASLLGVSRRTISKYEDGEMAASVDVAIKLEEVLDRGFTVSVDIFEKLHSSESQKQETAVKQYSNVFSILENMGFDVMPISQAPFDAVSQTSNRKDENSTILTGVGDYTRTIVKKAHLMSSISEVAGTQSLLIVHGVSKTKNIEKTVLIDDKELKKFDDKDDFIDLLQERRQKIKVS